MPMEKKYRPLVTIAIPNYNYGHYLEYCLDSVLNQTYENLEVYFNDNASTDNSYEIALAYREKFRKKGIYFRVSENKRNLGSDKNTNIANRDAEGAYVYTLASDDAIAPNFIERCMDVFIKYPNVGTVIVNREEIDETGRIKKQPPFYDTSCIIPKEEQCAVYMMAGIAIPAQRMFRREMVGQVKAFWRNWNVAGDWYNNFLLALVGDVAYIKEDLVQYRVHSGNETTESERNLLGVTEHYQLIHSFVDLSRAYGFTKPIQRYEAAIEKLGSMCLRYALKMLKNKRNDVAQRYLLQAPVWKKDITEDERYKILTRCVDLKGTDLEREVKRFEEKYELNRSVSYAPPEGFIPLEERR